MVLAVSSMSGFGSGGGSAPFVCQSVDWDGTNDYAHRNGGWTSGADTSSGIFSLWIRIDGNGSGNEHYIYATAGYTHMLKYNWQDKWHFQHRNADGSGQMDGTNSPVWGVSATWLHLYWSWDTNKSAGNKDFVFKINGAANTPYNVGDSSSAFNVDHTTTDVDIASANASNDKWDGLWAEFYLDINAPYSEDETLFRDGDGKPVNLGDDGSGPTGSQPVAYFSVREGDSASDFLTNRGYGGNIVMEDSGSLSIGDTSPSD